MTDETPVEAAIKKTTENEEHSILANLLLHIEAEFIKLKDKL